MTKEDITFDAGTVDRRYTKQWAASGIININALPEVVRSLVSQREEMVSYIEALHDTIDFILRKNKCCDVGGCLTAGCTSDHK